MSTSQGAVLIAEDDGPIRNLLAYHLRREGFRVMLAQDGEEAVAMSDVGLRLALVDLWMPRLDGMAVLRHLRRHCPAVPVVIISAHAGDAEIEALRVEGAFGFVSKPFRILELLRVVRSALAAREAAPSAVPETTRGCNPALPSAPATP